MEPDATPAFVPVNLAPDGEFVPLGPAVEFDATFDSEFEAHPFAQTVLRLAAAATGDPGACVLVGVSIEGATAHAPGAGDLVLRVRPGADATRTTLHFTRHPGTAAPPRFWPADRAWPGDPPAGHLVPGPHRATLWARAVGGSARVVAAILRAEPRPG